MNNQVHNFDKIICFNPKVLSPHPSWMGHLHFAYWLVSIYKPKIFVELGTHSGNSYFSFCQSVLDFKLNTKCFAVDSWEGDEHTGKYNTSIYKHVIKNNNRFFSKFSKLLRMDFDAANKKFKNGTIDLLHIDGYHTYEAVKHDFETWLPKLKKNAIIIFHDTNVFAKDFGVHKFWRELKDRYPKNLDFSHGHGLGVINLGVKKNHDINWIFENKNKDMINNIFKTCGEKLLETYKYNTEFNQLKNTLLQLENEKNKFMDELNQIHNSKSWNYFLKLRDLYLTITFRR